MDALVAEKVMGWKPTESYWPSQSYRVKCWNTPQSNVPLDMACLPHYSTDIAAAWQVVERLRDHQDPRVPLAFGQELQRLAGKTALEAGTLRDWWLWITPEAICRAALNVLG